MKLGVTLGNNDGGEKRHTHTKNVQVYGYEKAYRARDCHLLIENLLKLTETKGNMIRIYIPLQSMYYLQSQ